MAIAVNSELHRLSAGPLEVDLVPGIGGSVAAFRYRGIDILRPLSAVDLAAGNVLGTAIFPMTPYANRIANNAFIFRDKIYRFSANNPPERFNVHGTGWHRIWSANSLTGNTAMISLSVNEEGSPYHYLARQHFVLDTHGLTVTISLRNGGAVTMPFGFGLHPWFPRGPDTTLTFEAQCYYLEGPDQVSLEPLPLPAALDFSTSRSLPEFRCNNDFGGWGGRAILDFPSRGVVMTLSADPIFRKRCFGPTFHNCV